MAHKFKATLTRPEGTGTWTYIDIIDIPFYTNETFGCLGLLC